MTGLLSRLARDQTIEALVLGPLAAQARQRRARLGPPPAVPHPFPDLTGQPVPVIADAVLASIIAFYFGERS